MARNDFFDISIFGDKKLQRKLRKLERKVQRKFLREEFKESSNRLQSEVVQYIDRVLGRHRGIYRNAWADAKTATGKAGSGVLRVGIVLPSREDLAIAADDPNYYPYAIEYGHGNVPAHPHIRPAVDNNADAELAKIGRGLGRKIEREARKK